MTIRSSVKMRQIPEIENFERFLLLHCRGNGVPNEYIAQCADKVAKIVFGITLNDTYFDLPSEFESLDFEDCPPNIQQAWNEHDSKFDTAGKSTAETLEILKRYGFDFSDERGHALQCMDSLTRMAEAVGKGIAGRLMDVSGIEAEEWGKRLRQGSVR